MPIRWILALALAAALAACANEPRRDLRHGGHGPPRAARARPPLFISPSGEPFRGGGGMAAWFAQADADHDGAISEAEFQADAARFFRSLDANGDGVIDGFELQAYEQTVAPEVAAFELEGPAGREGGRFGGGPRGARGRRGRGGGAAASSEDGAPHPAGREGAARYSLINEPEPLTNADENLDGRVSMQEWRRATERRFKLLDKAKTGRLTLETLRAPPR